MRLWSLIRIFARHHENWGLQGYTLFFLFLLKNIDCGYSLELPCRGSSNEYPQSIFWAEIWKKSDFFFSEKFHFLAVKFSVYLNRHVFVMYSLDSQGSKKFSGRQWNPDQIAWMHSWSVGHIILISFLLFKGVFFFIIIISWKISTFC